MHTTVDIHRVRTPHRLVIYSHVKPFSSPDSTQSNAGAAAAPRECNSFASVLFVIVLQISNAITGHNGIDVPVECMSRVTCGDVELVERL